MVDSSGLWFIQMKSVSVCCQKMLDVGGGVLMAWSKIQPRCHKAVFRVTLVHNTVPQTVCTYSVDRTVDRTTDHEEQAG